MNRIKFIKIQKIRKKHIVNVWTANQIDRSSNIVL